jgi:hypothetical protein
MFDASIIIRWLRSWSALAWMPKSFSDAIVQNPSFGGPIRHWPAQTREKHQGMMQSACQMEIGVGFQSFSGRFNSSSPTLSAPRSDF